ncbi:hypothetical protein ABK040_015141 [Willaertia magna]
MLNNKLDKDLSYDGPNDTNGEKENNFSNDKLFDHLSDITNPIESDNQVKRVLVVDDDNVARQILTKLLEQLGFEVKAVEGGKQALELLREGNDYDLLLLDVLMPDVDGIQLLKIFRQAYSEDIPIIMVSSSEDPDTISQCFQSGAEDFLQKPVRFEMLKRRVNMCLEDRSRRRKEKTYQEMLQKERINRKKLYTRVKEQEKELEQIKSQINNAVETPMQVVMKTISDLMEGKYSVEQYKGALIAIVKSLGSKDLYKPAFSNLLRRDDLDDSTRNWLQSEYMSESDGFALRNTNERHPSISILDNINSKVHPIVVEDNIPSNMESHEFDVFSHSIEQLMRGVVQMFEQLGLLETFKISPTRLLDFLRLVRDHYNNNPYHNFIHALDVSQFVYHCLCVERIASMFAPLDVLALMFSAIVHDVCHPGFNNNFLVNIKHELALVYNDVSVLENHHASQAFYLLRSCNICENLTKDEYRDFRRLVISTILSTDMAHHFEILTKFQTRLQTGPLSRESKEDKQQLMSIVLKCADVSNATRPQTIAKRWSEHLLNEFFHQGDEERERGLPISPLMDRHNIDIAKSQLNFIDYIAYPLFKTLLTFSPHFNNTVGETIKKNREFWEEVSLTAVVSGVNLSKIVMGNNTNTKLSEQTEESTSTINQKSTDNNNEPTTMNVPVLTGTLPDHLAKVKGFSVLIIDDQTEYNAKQLSQPLLTLCYQVIITTPPKVEDKVKETRFDCILLNYDLRGADEIVQKIRLINAIVPIITLSDSQIQTDWCQAHFVRPVNVYELVNAIAHVIENYLDKVEPVERELALEQTGGDEEFLVEMLEQQVSSGHSLIEKIKQAIKERDWANMELHSHSLKGSAAQLACKPLSQAALVIEACAKNHEDNDLEKKVSLLEKRLLDLEEYVKNNK